MPLRWSKHIENESLLKNQQKHSNRYIQINKKHQSQTQYSHELPVAKFSAAGDLLALKLGFGHLR
jgi:hypothetical protein